MAVLDFRGAKEKMERDLSLEARKLGIPEREAAEIARKRTETAMQRGVNVAIEEGTTKPVEI